MSQRILDGDVVEPDGATGEKPRVICNDCAHFNSGYTSAICMDCTDDGKYWTPAPPSETCKWFVGVKYSDTGCKHGLSVDLDDVRDFVVCPYCTKRIEVVR